MRKTAIAAALIVTATAATSAFAISAAASQQPNALVLAQADHPAPPPHAGERGPDRRGPDGRGPRHEHGPRHGKGERFALKLAERLSAIEVAIGVKSDQLDAWRAFTSAAVDFASPSRPPAPPSAGESQRPPERPRGVLGMADRMADRSIERAEKAKTLKAAVEALRQKLTPEQIAKLDAMPVGPERHGKRGWGGHGGPERHGPHGGPR